MKQIKIISATAVVIFTLFSSFSGAIAWFQTRRNETVKASDFYVESIDTAVKSIKLYSYYGETVDEETACYTFDPNYVTVYSDGEFNDEAPLVTLNPYSVEKPHHPVLLVYEVEGLRTRIDLTTDYCFLGADTDFITAKTGTKAELAELSKQANAYYEVAHDESNSNKTTLYQYVNSELVNMTVDAYSDLNSKKTSANNNKYFRVTSDSTRSGVASIYQYKHVKSDFELVWLDLGVYEGTQPSDRKETNPLSSVVDFYSITSNDFSTTGSNHKVSQESFNENTQDYQYTTQDSLNCITVAKSKLTDSNKHSFTNFTGPEDYDPYQEINVYDDETADITYVGVIIDYDQLALEYIFSRNLGHDALNYGLMFECDWTTKF